MVSSLVLMIYFDRLQLDTQEKLYKTLDIDPEICSILTFLEKSLGIVTPQFLKCFSYYIMLTDQISQSYCLYF